VVVIIYMRASYFVLDGMGAAMLGIYALADRITNPILRITGPLSGSVLPVFAELAEAGQYDELAAFYRRTLGKLVWLLLVSSALIYGVAPWAIRTWLPEYLEAMDVMYVLMLGVGFMMFNQINVACLNGLGRFGTVAVVATINLTVYAFCAWLWVAEYKALGAALATTVMEGCNMMMQLGLLAWTFRQRQGAQAIHG
jgi:O-antigen/teichoic acid export membrane protein